MKKFQIFKQKNGEQPKGYNWFYGTFEEAQEDLRGMLNSEFSEKHDMAYLNSGWDGGDYEGYHYTERGWYSPNTGELHISDREINAPDFDRYGYDNWTEYIEEIEVEDE